MRLGDLAHRARRQLDAVMLYQLLRGTVERDIGSEIRGGALQRTRTAATLHASPLREGTELAAARRQAIELFSHFYAAEEGVPVEPFFFLRATPGRLSQC